MPKWIRVRDTQTGHQFDIDGRVLPHRRGVEPVDDQERWPDLEGPHARPRPAKPHVGKDGLARRIDGGQTQGDATTDGGSVDQQPDEGSADQPTSRAKRNSSRTTSTPADMPADTTSDKE